MNKIKEIKKVISFSLITSMALTFGYMNFEPEMAGAADDGVTVSQAISKEISISDLVGPVTMTSIQGMTGGTGTGSGTWTVTTNSSTGFTMSLKSDQSAGTGLTSGTDTIADYTPGSAGLPDYEWGAAPTATSEFGFTVEPATSADTVQNFLNAAGPASPCNTSGGINTTEKCWLDFNGTTEIPVINRSTETSSSGEAELVRFKTDVGATRHQESGTYTAIITATVVVQ